MSQNDLQNYELTEYKMFMDDNEILLVSELDLIKLGVKLIKYQMMKCMKS
jgi:hypothetical protein